MNLPSFIWLWRIAAWSMGLSVFSYFLLAISGMWMFYRRKSRLPRPAWLRPFHYLVGTIMVVLILFLLSIGLIGTIGYYGSLGHSPHLIAGLLVVILALLSAWSATQIRPNNLWARSIHIKINLVLFCSLIFVSLTGWSVVQKYLP